MKANSKIIILSFLFLCTNLHAQKEYFNFTQITVKDIQAIENAFHSKEVFSKYKIFHESEKGKMAQPKLYKRPKTDEFPVAATWYFFTEKDSIVRSVSYHWGVDVDNSLPHARQYEKYSEEFDRLVKVILKYIGEPEPNQGKMENVQDIVVSDPQTYSTGRSVRWKYKNCTVSINLTWSENHGQSFVTYINWNE